MSWFDATGFANLAKSALKEAQKTIDKALDIKDEEQQLLTSPTSPDVDTDKFFASWGLKTSGEADSCNTEDVDLHTGSGTQIFGPIMDASTPREQLTSSTNKLAMTTSLWGSFTGSFFDSPQTDSGDVELVAEEMGETDGNPVSRQPKKISLFRTSSDQRVSSSVRDKNVDRKSSWDREYLKSCDVEESGLCDDSIELGEGFSRSKLVVESEDGDQDTRSRLSSCEGDEEVAPDPDKENRDLVVCVCEDQFTRRREPSSNYKYNRLSVISSESDKKSSESVEVLGSEAGSGFTTSPESDMPLLSPEMSPSGSNLALRLSAAASSPESVEVIPDTPSSVEVLGDDSSGRTSRMTCSPYVSPADPPDLPRTLADVDHMSYVMNRYKEGRTEEGGWDTEKISPESVEVIAEEDDEEEGSVADDSYTSASESTATATTTIAEPPGYFSDRSPHHKAHAASAETSSNESSLYASTVGSDVKSPHTSARLAHQNLASMESSFHDNLVQSGPAILEPVMTHGGNRSVLQLALMHSDPPPDKHHESPRVVDSRAERLDFHDQTSPQSLGKIGKLTTNNLASYDSTQYDKCGSFHCGTIDCISVEGLSMESSSDTLVTAVDSASEDSSRSPLQQTSSFYVKTMLADAMGDDDPKETRTEELAPAREQSPISSESRSDMVKVESEQTSGHTSGDELETTTSSDIEIISSPNGDSSSTQSRQSPAKLMQHVTRVKSLARDRSESPACEAVLSVASGSVKGHQRELSETSSGGSDDSHCAEVDKLSKRMGELTEILEVRESKLVELSRINIELQEANADLKCQLEAALHSCAAECPSVHQITEEYTQRLSSLEKKFQQAIREKDALRKQLDHAKQDAASRLSTGELETLVADKEEVIRELREEGEKLSKQHLQLSNIIKKLRVKEKETDNAVKNQKEQLEGLAEEVDRLKRCLAAKEEVERTQIEAVHQLTAKAKIMEKNNVALQDKLDETNKKLVTLKEQLEISHKELTESKNEIAERDTKIKEAMLSAECVAKNELTAALEEAQRMAQEERDQLITQLEETCSHLKHVEEEHARRESSLRQECSILQRRLAVSENEAEELAQNLSTTTKPLFRQIASNQAAFNAQQAGWEKQEQILTDKLSEVQGHLASLKEQKRTFSEQCVHLQSRVSEVESQLATATKELVQAKGELELQRAESTKLKQDKDKEELLMQSLKKCASEQLTELRREVTGLEQQLAVERAANEAEKRRTTLLQDQLKERHLGTEAVERTAAVHLSPSSSPQHSSPTLSFGHVSLSESVSSAMWPMDDVLDCGSSSGRLGNVYDSLRTGNTSSVIEGLQSQLKLRDGEVQQLQWDVVRRDAERAAVTSELSQLTAAMEAQEERLQEAERLKEHFTAEQHKYNALLQMYGEKVEETEELKLDLEDVKEMYKMQIDQLLKKEPSSKEPN